MWSTQLINHALLKPYKHYNRLGEATRNPAYLPPSAFVLALLDLVRPAQATQRAAEGTAADVAGTHPAESNLLEVIKILEREAKGDAAKLSAALEAWFNGQMDRVTGSYKRWAKRLAIPIALVIAVGFNIDTVEIARSVYTDESVRSAVLGRRGERQRLPARDDREGRIDGLPGCNDRRSEGVEASGRLVEAALRGGAGNGLLAGRHEAVGAAAHHGSGLTRRPVLVRPAQPAGLAPQRRYQTSKDLVTHAIKM